MLQELVLGPRMIPIHGALTYMCFPQTGLGLAPILEHGKFDQAGGVARDGVLAEGCDDGHGGGGQRGDDQEEEEDDVDDHEDVDATAGAEHADDREDEEAGADQDDGPWDYFLALLDGGFAHEQAARHDGEGDQEGQEVCEEYHFVATLHHFWRGGRRFRLIFSSILLSLFLCIFKFRMTFFFVLMRQLLNRREMRWCIFVFSKLS